MDEVSEVRNRLAVLRSRAKVLARMEGVSAVEFSHPVELKALVTSDGWDVSGYVSVFNVVDAGNDIVLPGAFRDTLKSGRKVRFLFNHDAGRILGVTKSLKEDSYGLFGNFRISKTRLGEETRQLLRDGAIDSFSFGYSAKDWENRRDGVRLLKAVELFETSLVAVPMADGAVVTGYNSIRLVETARTKFRMEELRRKYRV
jgi:HK97 family phage prohead protease